MGPLTQNGKIILIFLVWIFNNVGIGSNLSIDGDYVSTMLEYKIIWYQMTLFGARLQRKWKI